MPLYEGLSGKSLINEKNTTVVFDFGTAYTKAGFAGECGPRVILRSEIKCRETGEIVPVFDTHNADQLRHRLVDFIHQIYFKHLLVNPKDRRVVLVECLLSPSMIRNTLAKVLFRHYEVLSVVFAPSHLLSLMTLGINTGLVLDIGYQEAAVLPVYEGVPILKASQALALGGKAVHSSLNELLLDRALSVGEDGKEMRLSSVMENVPEKVLEDIKVRTCFVSTIERSQKLQNNKYDRSNEPPPPPPSVLYHLSGSRTLTVPGTVRELATEVLFEQDRDILSLPSIILKALLKCPIDTRRALAENLIIIGGMGSMTGLKHRLLSEVRALAASDIFNKEIKLISFKVHKPPAQDNYVSWLGGAILGGTEAVALRTLPRDEYLLNDRVPDWCDLSCNIKEDRDEKSA